MVTRMTMILLHQKFVKLAILVFFILVIFGRAGVSKIALGLLNLQFHLVPKKLRASTSTSEQRSGKNHPESGKNHHGQGSSLVAHKV
jgi:hypothetical protein